MVASLFVAGLQFLTGHRRSMDSYLAILEFAGGSLVPMIWLIGAAFLLWAVRRLFGMSRWYGPADSIFGAHRQDNEINVKAGIGSTVGAFVSLAGGASVGQYGPLVHFGATIGSYIRQVIVKYEIDTKKLAGTDVYIGCGVAAAIAAGFHAPIAGIVFAHEAVLRHFSFRALTPIAIASITSVWFSTAIFGDDPLFKLDAVAADLLPMVPILLASGLLFGVIALVFMLMLLGFASIATKSRLQPLGLALVAAVACGTIAIFVPEILGSGVEEINVIFGGGFALGFLFLLFICKILATSVCVGFGLFGGVFSPAAMIGAAAGGFIGKFLTVFGFTTVPYLLPVAGFAAVTAAVVGAPISVVLIVFELTQSYEFAVAAMLAAVIATFFTSLVFGHSFFDEQLMRRGIDLSRGRSDLELQVKPILQVIDDKFVAVGADASVKDVIAALIKAEASEGYCIEDNKTFIGKYALTRLMSASSTASVREHLMQDPISLNHDASVLQAMEVASNFVGESIPVIHKENGQLLGVVSEADIFNAYLTTQSQVHDLEHN